MIQSTNGRKARTERECPSSRDRQISDIVTVPPKSDDFGYGDRDTGTETFHSPLAVNEKNRAADGINGPVRDDYLDFGNSPLRDAYSST